MHTSFLQLNLLNVGVARKMYEKSLSLRVSVVLADHYIFCILQCFGRITGAKDIPSSMLNKYFINKHIKELIVERDGK